MTWWKEHDKWIEQSQPMLLASDIIKYYIREEKPIEGRVLYHLLEPFVFNTVDGTHLIPKTGPAFHLSMNQ